MQKWHGVHKSGGATPAPVHVPKARTMTIDAQKADIEWVPWA